MSSYKNVAIQYAMNVINDNILSCLYTKQSAQRFLNDLNNTDYYYDDDAVNIVIDFCQSFDLTEVSPPRKTKLEPWQVFIIVNLYGLLLKSNNWQARKS
jgi:phage terminase large subunit-like protein